ncbi:MAG TPA: CocE/NonD family hydrolase [Acidimicrobiia bacterium]|nr:CocE/NonD family hydrolase [Acidimicrobiia bacterium]
MITDWDVPIPMSDGLVLRGDVYRPDTGSHPVIVSYGPYAKGLAFQVGYPDQWNTMVGGHPDVSGGSSNRYQSWEVVDPEKWVPEGYVCLRVDSRGAGRSPGYIDHFSPRETQDLYESIEWAAAQPWSTGRIGLNGVSYYGINQWQVASLRPPSLAAMCVWEGASDHYRDMTHHGGILCTFFANWYDKQVKTVQHGLGTRGPASSINGLQVCGDEDLSDEELAQNRVDLGAAIASHPFDDQYHRDRSAVFEQITTPLLSAGNWGGHGLHLRGNVEGFMGAGSTQKWLELHGLEHWTHFYTDYGRLLQLEFFDHFLKDEDNGWDRRPPVLLNVRHVDHFEPRTATSWPLPETNWTRLYLDPDLGLGNEPVDGEWQVSFPAMGDGLTFLTEPYPTEVEITGPSAARLRISSSTEDADLFIVLRLFDPAGDEVTFQGALDPHSPLAHGWLRASHRRTDPDRSTEWRPYHQHTDREPLVPGMAYDLDIEIWPTSIVVPPGHRLGVTIRGKDYQGTAPAGSISTFKNPFTGVGPFLHDDPGDRPPEVFAGVTTIHGSGESASILLPFIPRTEVSR